MNNSTVAKNGFKTFIWTLAVSLVIFSVIYYIATDASSKVSVEGTDKITQNVKEQKNVEAPLATTQVSSTKEASVFKELANQKVAVPTKAVLGGADAKESTQSTVPGTGITEITYAFIISIAVVVFGAYLFIFEPRRKALLDFEKRVKRGL